MKATKEHDCTEWPDRIQDRKLCNRKTGCLVDCFWLMLIFIPFPALNPIRTYCRVSIWVQIWRLCNENKFSATMMKTSRIGWVRTNFICIMKIEGNNLNNDLFLNFALHCICKQNLWPTRWYDNLFVRKYLIFKWKLASCVWAWSPLSSLTIFFSISPPSHISLEFSTAFLALDWHIRESLSPWKTYWSVNGNMIKYLENNNLKLAWKAGGTLGSRCCFMRCYKFCFTQYRKLPLTFHSISNCTPHLKVLLNFVSNFFSSTIAMSYLYLGKNVCYFPTNH